MGICRESRTFYREHNYLHYRVRLNRKKHFNMSEIAYDGNNNLKCVYTVMSNVQNVLDRRQDGVTANDRDEFRR